MASTEKIHLTGQLISSGHPVDPSCDVSLNPGVRFRVLMDLKKDEQGHYRVSMNKCKFDISDSSNTYEFCDSTNDARVSLVVTKGARVFRLLNCDFVRRMATFQNTSSTTWRKRYANKFTTNK